MEEYQKETTRTLFGILIVGMLLFLAISASSCTSASHTTKTQSSCPAYN